MKFVNPRNDVVPEHVNDSALQNAYQVANRFAWSQEDLEAYEYRGIRMQDELGAIEHAHQRGLEMGLERGAMQKAIETAINLSKMGLNTEQISQATGLSVEEVEQCL
jgi:predicted transposase/invertase (TIGR01784 family)